MEGKGVRGGRQAGKAIIAEQDGRKNSATPGGDRVTKPSRDNHTVGLRLYESRGWISNDHFAPFSRFPICLGSSLSWATSRCGNSFRPKAGPRDEEEAGSR